MIICLIKKVIMELNLKGNLMQYNQVDHHKKLMLAWIQRLNNHHGKITIK